ncbi:MAG TPA: SRPBCC family protein [Actinomycetota bacterium]|jgi:uncharacterized protein YndB with AHSA1/START domain
MIGTITPIEIEITVAASVEDAFATFTGDITSWWPSATHSVGEERVAEVVMEPRTGGRLFERWDDGTEHDWGEILEWEAPNRLVCSWQPNPERPAATEIEVTFEGVDGGTRVRLEHRGWERLGEQGPGQRRDYSSGWAPVLEGFARRCEAGSADRG